LKTAGLPSAIVRQRPLEFDRLVAHSAKVQRRAPLFGKLAVMLAVSARREPQTMSPRIQVFDSLREKNRAQHTSIVSVIEPICRGPVWA
jgi:hypothetical protein